MQEIVRYGFILALICILSSGLLAGVNSLTKARIIAQAQAEEQASLKEVVAQGARFAPVKSNGDTLYYRVYDQEGKLIALAFKASAKGYSSTIETMAGMNVDGTIMLVKILSQNETPGIGARIAEREFSKQFSEQKDLGRIQAITGATISSQAVIDSVKKKAEEVKAWLKETPNNE